jgi:hypothetical protein
MLWAAVRPLGSPASASRVRRVTYGSRRTAATRDALPGCGVVRC